MEEEKKLHLSVDEGKEFFAHEMNINFNPTQLVFDFRCVTPRNDLRQKEMNILVIKHNTVMMEPWQAKEMYNLLGESIKLFEKECGKIHVPDKVKEFIDKKKKESKDKTEVPAPSYLG